MNHKTIFMINGVLLLGWAVGFLFLPTTMLGLYGAATDATGISLGRMLGGVMFGNAVLMYLARDMGGEPGGKVVAIQQTVDWAIATIVILTATLAGLFGALMWSSVVIGALLTVAFAYLAFFTE